MKSAFQVESSGGRHFLSSSEQWGHFGMSVVM
jgi:hypothetical protein